MVKKKKGKKGKKAVKKGAHASKKKGPTEKELFEIQVEELREQVELTHTNLERLRAEQEASRSLFDGETASKESCVAHLRRVLQREGERRFEVQEKLQTERELGELAERRFLGKFNLVDRSNEASRGVSLQQKMELEGKLLLLEELRLKRDSQQATLRRVEAALAEKAAILSQKTREEDRNHVDRLLRNREKFVRMCEDMKIEWSDAFKLRMPVQAQKQLEENVRLRGVCRDTTKTLLQAQDQNRILKQRQKSINLDEEIQTFAEENAADRKNRQESRMKQLQRQQEQLLSADEKSPRKDKKDSLLFDRHAKKYIQAIQHIHDRQDSFIHEATEEYVAKYDEEFHPVRGQHAHSKQDSFELFDFVDSRDRNGKKCQQNQRQDVGTKQDSFVEMVSEGDKAWNTDDTPDIQDNTKTNTKEYLLVKKSTEDNRARNMNEPQIHVRHDQLSVGRTSKRLADEKMTSIKRCKIERCRLEDMLQEVDAILEDQSSYKKSLDYQIEKQHVDRNGVMISAILRAGKIFESRCCKMEKNDADLDFDVLHQIRMLLDLSDVDSAGRS